MVTRHARHFPNDAARSSRRVTSSALVLGALLAGSLPLAASAAAPEVQMASSRVATLPASSIEKIEQADGMTSKGVLTIDIDRSDISVRGIQGRRFADGFEVAHELYFQSLPGGLAAFNGSVAVRPSEIQRVLKTITSQGLTLQAFHQHYTDLSPLVWFIHFRGVGNPLTLARQVHAVVRATSTPLPQSSPKNPTTPLPYKQLGSILGGDATVGAHGVVNVDLPRKQRITLGGRVIDSGLGVQATVSFQPVGTSGQAIVAPDFSLTATEVNPVTQIMLSQGWEDGCLYNQELGESPQLFFSHMIKVGDAVSLARQIRAGLRHTAAG